jgi:hypothetical protein
VINNENIIRLWYIGYKTRFNDVHVQCTNASLLSSLRSISHELIVSKAYLLVGLI